MVAILLNDQVKSGDLLAIIQALQAKGVHAKLLYSRMGNVVADDALSGGRSKAAGKYRADRYAAFAKRWLADTPAMPLYQTKTDYIQSRSVSTIADDAKLVAAEDRYSNVIYWATEKTSVYKTP